MVITKTPFRISFVGGGSDLKDFYSQYSGAVLSTTINKYMYISSHRPFEDFIRAKYAKTETVKNVDQLKHPIIRAILKKFDIKNSFEIASISDIPAGTGLASSSSFTVGLLQNLYAVNVPVASKDQLAEDACHIEIDILNEPIGKQDQYAAAHGGMNVINFNQDGSVSVEPVNISAQTKKQLEENLVLFYIGKQREASSVLKEQMKNMRSQDKVEMLKDMVALVPELKTCLEKGDLDLFGGLLHKNWLFKQQLSAQISNNDINNLYELGIKNGATGGKLLGAGGGGFLLFYCEKQRQDKLRNALSSLKELDFEFDVNGSQVIYKDA